MVERVFGQHRKENFTNIHVLVAEFVEQVNAVCTSMLPEADKLDTPNVHRILELTIHSLPTYGLVKHVSDLFFSKASIKSSSAACNAIVTL